MTKDDWASARREAVEGTEDQNLFRIKILCRPATNSDLVATYRCYARTVSLRIDDRFIAQAEATTARLACMAGFGERYQPYQPGNIT